MLKGEREVKKKKREERSHFKRIWGKFSSSCCRCLERMGNTAQILVRNSKRTKNCIFLLSRKYLIAIKDSHSCHQLLLSLLLLIIIFITIIYIYNSNLLANKK